MITKLTHSFIYVLDLERAINFYTRKLGLTIHTDIIVNGDKWVTLCAPEQPDFQILLIVVEEGMIFKS
ncbi:MAG TPA: VOC family protein, partial [Cyclobacteriaceae bacterium]